MTLLESNQPSVRTVLGTCHHDCPDSCGWVATVEDQKNDAGETVPVVLKLRGNPEHPYSKGELCPKVNRFVDRVYSPDRLLHPLIRTGAKGTGEFRHASWEEALGVVVERVTEERDRHGGETIFPWFSAGTQGAIQEHALDRAFFSRLGASRMVDSICGVAAGAGMAATYGGAGLGADPLNLVHAELVILWGTNTRLTNRHLWPFVEQARDNGARIVCIDPLRTMTAESADWHLQPLPGTDTALILAMMHVLIEEDLIDHDYVDKYAEGWDELAAHVQDWTPERAAAITGLSVEDIRELAVAYGSAKPAFIRSLIGSEHHENGAMFYRAAACLPVLTGSWRHLGGGMARSVGAWQEEHDVNLGAFDGRDLATAGARRPLSQNRIGQALTDMSQDPPVQVLFVWGGNPLVSIPEAGLTREGLAREDLFTVVSEQFMTDTARFADVIFPATTQLEQIDVVPGWGHLWLGWNDRAIPPRGEAVPNTELWRRLAAAFGFSGPEFERHDEELVAMVLHDDVDLDEMRATGFVRITGTENLQPYTEGGFATPSGKALLVNPALEKLGLPSVPDFIAPKESPAGDPALAERFPLMLMTPKQHTRFLNSSYSGLAGHGDREGEPVIELDAVDAAARGLADGDMAQVFNDRARLTLRVRITDRVRPGLASAPWGWWSKNHPDGITVNDLTNATPTDFGGGAAYNDTLVQVSPAG